MQETICRLYKISFQNMYKVILNLLTWRRREKNDQENGLVVGYDKNPAMLIVDARDQYRTERGIKLRGI